MLARFIMIGSGQTPILKVQTNSLADLALTFRYARWIEAEMVEIDGEAVSRQVLVPTGRIQMIIDESMA